MEELTSRERVLRALERRDHDRVPRDESFWPDTLVRWAKEGVAPLRELADVPRSDANFWTRLWEAEGRLKAGIGADIAGAGWLWPSPFPGRAETVAEDAETRTVVNEFGARVRYWKQRNGTPEHLGFTCDSPEVWRRRFRPGFEANGIQLDVAGVVAAAAAGRAGGKFVVFKGVEAWEMLRAMLGDEGMALAMGEEPEWVREISEFTTGLILENLQAAQDAGADVDGVWIYGDMAYTNAPFCSPAMYRDLLWPDHARMARWAHERGLKFIYHTDGDVRGMMGHYLEAEFDALQPMEAKARMDVRELAPEYGDRITLFGNLDARVLATNDPGRIEAEVASKLRAGKERRGYIAHSDHSVPPDVAWETFLAYQASIEHHSAY